MPCGFLLLLLRVYFECAECVGQGAAAAASDSCGRNPTVLQDLEAEQPHVLVCCWTSLLFFLHDFIVWVTERISSLHMLDVSFLPILRAPAVIMIVRTTNLPEFAVLPILLSSLRDICFYMRLLMVLLISIYNLVFRCHRCWACRWGASLKQQ